MTIYDKPTPSRWIEDLSTSTVLANPTSFEVGTVIYMQDTDAFYQNVLLAGNVQAWRPAGGAGNLSKYWVAPPTSAALLGPVAPYTTIQAAINAAVADGHSAAQPAVVYVFPGTYTENPVMKDGVSVKGMSAHVAVDQGLGGNGIAEYLDVILVGNVTFDAAFTGALIDSIRITGTVAIGANANISTLTMRDVDLRSSAASPFGGAPTSGPSILLERCRISNSVTQGAGLPACVSFTTAVSFSAISCSFNANAGTDISVNFVGSAAQSINFEKSKIFGILVNTSGAGVYTIEDVDHTVTGATAYISVTAGAPTFTARRWSRTGSTSATPYVGTFTINETDHVGDANSETILATMTTGALRTPKRLTGTALTATVTAAQFQSAGDLVEVNTSVGPGTVALPAAAAVPAGLPKWIVAAPGSTGSGFAITITAGAGDTINGGAAAGTYITSASPKAAVCICRDPNSATNWLIIATDGSLGKYWVAPAGQQPPAPYQKIQDAINAAAQDGHTGAAANRTQVIVMPGTYSENLTLKDGIDVIGFSSLTVPMGNATGQLVSSFVNADAALLGNIALDAAFTIGTVAGIFINGVSATTTVNLGANAVLVGLTFRNCTVRAFGGAGALCFGGAPGGTPTVNIDSCNCVNLFTVGAGATSIINFTTAVNINLKQSSLAANAGTDVAISYNGGTHLVDSCRILGQVAYVAGGATDTYLNTFLAVTGATAYIAQTAGVTTVTFVNGGMSGITVGTIGLAGTFTFNQQGLASTDAGGILPASTVTTSSLKTSFPTSEANMAGGSPYSPTAAQIAANDTLTFTNAAAATTINLPAANLLPPGKQITFYNLGAPGANATTINKGGGDTVGGVAAYATAISIKGVTLRIGVIAAGNADWHVLATAL